MGSESKKHHFVPRFLLKNFHDGNGRLYVFDKLTGKSFSSNADNAGHENNFNSIEAHGIKFNFENFFEEIDSQQAQLIRKLTSFNSHWHLVDEDIYNLAYFTLVQMLRTKLPRTTMVEFTKEVKKWAEGITPLNRPKPIVPVILDEESKLLVLKQIEEIPDLVVHLLKRGITIFRAPVSNQFWSSDNPVVMYNPYPYGQRGLTCVGTDICFPISKDLMVCFICKTSCEKTKNLYDFFYSKGMVIPSEITDIYEAVYNNKIVEFEPQIVDYYNYLQIQTSSRFLYSSKNDFHLAKEIIEENQELKETKTTIGIGSKDNPSMPSGQHIVFYFKNGDHFMVTVKMLEKEFDLHFIFDEKDVGKIEMIVHSKLEIENIELYIDKRISRGMRDVEVTSYNYETRECIIAHRDKSFNSLLKMIKENKEKRTQTQ